MKFVIYFCVLIIACEAFSHNHHSKKHHQVRDYETSSQYGTEIDPGISPSEDTSPQTFPSDWFPYHCQRCDIVCSQTTTSNEIPSTDISPSITKKHKRILSKSHFKKHHSKRDGSDTDSTDSPHIYPTQCPPCKCPTYSTYATDTTGEPLEAITQPYVDRKHHKNRAHHG